MYCTKCGAQIDPYAKFCCKCGAPNTRVINKKRRLIVMIGIMLLFVGIGGYFMFHHSSNSNQVTETKSTLTTEEQYIVGEWIMSIKVDDESAEETSIYTLIVYENHTGEIVYTNNLNRQIGAFTWSYSNKEENSTQEAYMYDIQLTISDVREQGHLMYMPSQNGSSESLSIITTGSNAKIWSFENKSNVTI